MTNMLACLGYGYTARALARLLKPAGWAITGATRSAEKAAAIAADGAHIILWDGMMAPPDALLADATHILISAPPDDAGDPVLRAAGDAIAARGAHIRWIGYISSTGVYGDRDGAWVDETSELAPTTDRGRKRVASENVWREFAATHRLPLMIFRASGIYGPGRSALDSVKTGKARRVEKPGQVFNRIHVDDLAAALAASIAKPRPGAVYNLADDEASPPADAIDFAAKLLGIEPPPRVSLEDAEMSDMARSFYADNKRVRNDLMKTELGVRLAYPTYREGLAAIARRGGE